jgi:hypothetical protein
MEHKKFFKQKEHELQCVMRLSHKIVKPAGCFLGENGKNYLSRYRQIVGTS